MKPFDLSEALLGEPISFKGYKAYVHCSKKEENSYIVESAVSNTVWSPVSIDELAECTMWEELRPTVSLTLPCPLKEPQEEMWFITSNFAVVRSAGDGGSKYFLEEGRYFANKADAQAWLNALRNNRK